MQYMLKTTALQTRRSRVRLTIVSLEFFIDIIPPAALWPWDRFSLEENECQEYFLGGEGGRCVGLTTLTPSCAQCHEICEPELPGTLRACPGLYMESFTFTCYMLKTTEIYYSTNGATQINVVRKCPD